MPGINSLFKTWGNPLLGPVDPRNPVRTQQLVAVFPGTPQAFHSDCWLPLLQVAITSTCHGVDLRRRLEGCDVAVLQQERLFNSQTFLESRLIKCDPGLLIFMIHELRFFAESSSTALSADDTRPHCNDARCCSLLVSKQEFYGFKNVTETAIIVWSCALKQ